MPHYSDMDTPELKNKLDRWVVLPVSVFHRSKVTVNTLSLFLPSRFGVRPLPKRQMILKLKEIHQYTHQLASSDSEDEGRHPTAQMAAFKEPTAPPVASPWKSNGAEKEARQASEEAESLSASQGSSTSSMAASEESERYKERKRNVTIASGNNHKHLSVGVNKILLQHCAYGRV